MTITFTRCLRNFRPSQKIQIRFDFLRFRIRSIHFNRKGWRIRKNGICFSFCLLQMLTDGLECCGLLWCFYQTLILTAPIHCRASIAETLKQWHISTNSSSHHSQHIFILWWTIALSRIDAITDKHRKTDICSFVSALVTSGKNLNEKRTPVNTVKLS